MPSDDDGDSKIVEDVHVDFDISNVIKDTSINSCPLIPKEIPISSESTIDVVEALVDFSTPIPDDTYAHEDNQESQKAEIEFIIAIPSVSSSTKSLEFLDMVHKISSSASSFSG